MKAGIYARVSTENQREEATIDSQIAEIKEKIKQDNNILIDNCVYRDEGYSGELIARPALDKMRDDAKRGLFELLYVYDRGRLSRKYAYQELIIDELTDINVSFVTLHDVKAETAEEKVLQAMQGVFHEYERVKITERFRRGKLFKVRSGKLLGYCPPYGYDYIPKTKESDGFFSINNKEADVVKKIFSWIGEDGVSSNEVIRKLNKLNIPPKKQKRAIWTKGPIVRLLKNSTYYGEHYYYKSESVITKNHTTNGYKRVKKTGRRIRGKEEWILIETPAIISKDLFEKAQRQLEQNKMLCKRNNTKNEYLLRGFAYCSCGCRRAGESNKSNYSYYRCTDRLRKFPLPKECVENSINSKVADVLVWNKLVELLSNPKLIEKQATRYLANKTKENDQNQSLVQNNDKEKQKLIVEERRYTKAYGGGLISFDTFKSLAEDVKQRTKQWENSVEVEDQEKSNYNISPRQLALKTQQFIKNIKFSNKRTLICKLIEKIVMSPKVIKIYGIIPVNMGSDVVLSPNNHNCWVAR